MYCFHKTRAEMKYLKKSSVLLPILFFPILVGFTPLYQECIDETLGEQLDKVEEWGINPVQEWEIIAIDTITRGAIDGVGRSKNIADTIYNGRCGFAHFSYTWCHEMEDIYGEDWMYSPFSVSIQLEQWRSSNSRSVSRAMEHGWKSQIEFALAASISNSLGARGFTTLASRYHWDSRRVAMAYAVSSNHHMRRILYLYSYVFSTNEEIRAFLGIR